MFWEGLERGPATAADTARAAYHDEKVERFRELLPGVDRATAGELLLTIVSLVNAWPVLGHLDGFLVGDGPDRARRRRAALVASATALAREAAPRPRRQRHPGRRRPARPRHPLLPRPEFRASPDARLIAARSVGSDRRAADRRGNCHRGR